MSKQTDNYSSQEQPSSPKEGEDTNRGFAFLDAVGYSVSDERVERVWQRLTSTVSSADGYPKTSLRRKSAGPVVALAACAATFGVGVWFGQQHPAASGLERMVSAEPMLGATGNTSAGGQALRLTAVEINTGAAPPLVTGSRVGGGAGAGIGHSSSEHSSSEQLANPERQAASSTITSMQAGRVEGLTSEGAASVGSEPLKEASEEALPSALERDGVTDGTKTTSKIPPSWQRLANNGEYEAALVEITQGGGFERTLAAANAEQLMLMSDVARATGQQQRALAALRRIVSDYPADPVAPLAALNLGNLLEKIGDGAGATQAFAVYRSLSPKGDFVEDALVRQIGSAMSAGQQELARSLVAQYESDFPDGRRADEVARWSEQLPLAEALVDGGAADNKADDQVDPNAGEALDETTARPAPSPTPG